MRDRHTTFWDSIVRRTEGVFALHPRAHDSSAAVKAVVVDEVGGIGRRRVGRAVSEADPDLAVAAAAQRPAIDGGEGAKCNGPIRQVIDVARVAVQSEVGEVVG